MQRFVFLLFFASLFGTISAQYKNSNVRLAAMGESHMSWLFSDDTNHVPGAFRFGGGAELHADFFFRPQIAFSTGVAYTYTGGWMQYKESYVVAFQSGFDTLSPGTSMLYKLRYLDVPLGIKFTTREIGYLTWFWDTGINPLLRMNSMATTSDDLHDNDYVDKEVANFNLAYHVETGFLYSFGNSLALIVGFSYQNTFLDFTTDYLDKDPENSRINLARLKIGLAF